MKNQDFINSLPKGIFCISGSYAIKLQYKDFRDPSDIDIILDPDFQDFAGYKATQFEGNSINIGTEYEGLIIDRIEFSDGSRVDIIVEKFTGFNQVNGFNVLPISEIAKRKVQMMQYCPDSTDERYIKHLADIGFLISRKLITVTKL